MASNKKNTTEKSLGPTLQASHERKASEPLVENYVENTTDGVSDEIACPGDTDASSDSVTDETPRNGKKPAVKERSSKSGWIAAALAVALVGWMGSGFIFPGKEKPSVIPDRLQANEVKLVKVEAIASTAEKITQYLVSEGQALPNRLTQVRAEAPGNVEELGVSKGAFVAAGDIIARLSAEDRAAQEQEARAELIRRQRDFDAVQSLAKRGYATTARLEEARAALASAQARIASVSESLSDTVIRAPFSGVLDDLAIEVGEFVSGGKDIGTIVDVDPLIVEIQVPQQSVGKLSKGQEAEVAFITGEKRKGMIRYVSTNAQPATRTFAAEIEVPNPKRDIPAGISAQIRVPISAADAHFISPAVLSLGSDGTLGVKTVTEGSEVKFFPIEMVRAETKGIWVKGLPETVRIITIGQGFVSEGEKVEPSDGNSGPMMKPENNEADNIVASTAMNRGEVSTESKPAAKTQGDVAQAAKAPEGEQPIENKPIITPVEDNPESETQVALSRHFEPPVAGGRQIENMTAAIHTVQTGLGRLGYQPGPSDGVMGERTRDAIREFQKSLGFDATGLITFDLLDALADTLKAKG